ncbi:hypothetical protein C0989_004806 [Termitomyces sp. Mn162]|nr:hypothetical protein C0989_004806 [Termitomyces sp. Mn162]
MPEDPEVKIWWHRIQRWIANEFKRTEKNPLGYVPTLEQGNPDFASNFHDLARSKKKPWEYLVNQGLSPGPIHVSVRGKCLAIAAGHHCVAFNFGLEANVVQMSKGDFQLILAGDGPGPNDNKAKAERLRSFQMPKQFIEPGSSDSKRLVNIFAAFVSGDTVFAICDFARLVRMHIISSPTMWTENDLNPNSQHWALIWSKYPDGPDCIFEPQAWSANLDLWRSAMLAHKPGYLTSMVETMASNRSLSFGGFGRHLANDFLFLQAIHPGTPAHIVCSDDGLYQRFKNAIPPYMQVWISEDFFNTCGIIPNSLNPFAFNTTSNNNYTSAHIRVFRRKLARVPAGLYDLYSSLGLLDPDHVIGEKYTMMWKKCDTSFKWMPVTYYAKPLDGYTIIQAQPPEGYVIGPVKEIADIKESGYQTAIGPAQFRESLSNMHNFSKAYDELPKGGRPRKEHTNRRGRPRNPNTKKNLQKEHQALIKPMFSAPPAFASTSAASSSAASSSVASISSAAVSEDEDDEDDTEEITKSNKRRAI